MKFVFVESWPPSQILNFFTNIFFVSKERVKIQIIKCSMLHEENVIGQLVALLEGMRCSKSSCFKRKRLPLWRQVYWTIKKKLAHSPKDTSHIDLIDCNDPLGYLFSYREYCKVYKSCITLFVRDIVLLLC